MKRNDIDLIQRWLFFDQLSEQQVHERIGEYGVKIDVNAAIELAKLQKEYERGNVLLKTLTSAFEQHKVTK